MAKVIKAKDLKPSGTGWLELYWTPEDNQEITDKALFEIAWARWNSIEIGADGQIMMGFTKPTEEYNKVEGWRIWNEKPTREEREAVKWDG